jgi:hypothetical protein
MKYHAKLVGIADGLKEWYKGGKSNKSRLII